MIDEVSPEARQIGAVNTVTMDGAGRTRGHNTDRIGFRRGFEEVLGQEAARGKTILLVGAGGAGRAVAFALLDLGADVVLVYDTETARARGLAEALGAEFGKSRGRLTENLASAMTVSGGVVNATPVGMLGIPGIPVPADLISSTHWVADVIYTPLETDLFLRAKEKGCKVMGGAGMCVHQAAESFRLFTGSTPDIGRMRHVFVEAAAIRERLLAVVG